jgi:hypothetical protein
MASTTLRASRTRVTPRVVCDSTANGFAGRSGGWIETHLLEQRHLQLKRVDHLAVVAQRLGARRLVVRRVSGMPPISSSSGVVKNTMLMGNRAIASTSDPARGRRSRG